MRRKNLIALPTAGLLAFGVIGCSKQDAQSKTDEQINAIVESEVLALSAPLALPQSDRTYTVDQPGAVAIPADYTQRARRLDASIARIGEFNTIALSGSPTQQQIAREHIATVFRIESAYLASKAQEDFDAIRSQVVEMQPYGNSLSSLHGLMTELEGGHQTVIDTIQSGDMGEGLGVVELEGIDDLVIHQTTIRDRLEIAAQESDRLDELERNFHDEMIEDEGLELELRTESQGLTGDERYDRIDQAIRRQISSRIAQARSEYNGMLASIEDQNEALNRADLARVNKVIEDLKSAIADVQEEIDRNQDQLNTTTNAHRNLSTDLVDTFQQIEDRLDVLVIARFDSALEKLALSVDDSGNADYADASVSAVLERARITQQYAVNLVSYRDILISLSVYGADVLGDSLHQALTSRVDDLNARVAALASDAAGFKGIALDAFSDAADSVATDSEEDMQLASLKAILLTIFKNIEDAAE